LKPQSASPIATLAAEFQSRFGSVPRIFRAPGRVNLIGEHTDYNDGFVLPAALTLATWVAAAPRADRRLRIVSRAMPDSLEIDLDAVPPVEAHHWANYVVGVAVLLERSGRRLQGVDLLIESDVPVGSGLSSSAALELSSACALASISGYTLERLELALLAQKAEHEFAGVHCGIMDQYISAHGQAGKALLLDCRSLESRFIPVPDDLSIVVCNTMVKHALAGGEYNVRRQQCGEGVQLLAQHLPGVKSLRDVTPADLARYGAELPPLILRRARHIVHENDRTVRFAEALSNGDLPRAGRLMGESHRSLRDDYEVSCTELDQMVELAEKSGLCLGGRMTGGGFGGCTVNFVAASDAAAFAEHMRTSYLALTGLEPSIYVTAPGDGCGEVSL